MDKLLLHICCAPCSVACLEQLKEEGIAPTGFWYNPNIHLYQEYKTRRDTLIGYAEEIGLPLIIRDEYGLQKFTKAVCHDVAHRCGYCYALRFEETARTAKEQGFEAFSTTLTVSPYQDHELITEIGQKAAAKYGVKFRYFDFAPRFREGQNKARELGMYMQKYCGCIFSEEERYQKQIQKDQQKFQ